MTLARAMNAILLLALVLCGFAVTDVAYGGPARAPEPLAPEDQESVAVLRKRPAQFQSLQAADAAFREGRWEAAAAAYGALAAELDVEVSAKEALATAPSAADAGGELEATRDDDDAGTARRLPLRRRCQALTELGQRTEALAACEKLLKSVVPNAADLQAQVDALMLGSGKPAQADLQQAALMLRRAEGMDPDSVWSEGARCAIASRIGDRSALVACGSALSRLDPGGRLAQRFAPGTTSSFIARWSKVLLLGGLVLAALLTLLHRLRGSRRGAVAAAACALLMAATQPVSAEEAAPEATDSGADMMSTDPTAEPASPEAPGAELGGGTFDDEMAQVQALVDKITAAEALITEKNDWMAAVTKYNEIVKTVPYMVKAWRRLCEGYSYLNMPVEGAHCCRQAIESPETNAWDRAMLVHHLLTGPDREKPATQAEAKKLVAENITKWPNERWGYDAQCELALVQNDLPALAACSKQLDKLAPDDRKTIALLFSAALGEKRFDDAQKLIERATAGGMDESTIGAMRTNLASREPLPRRLLRWAPIGLGVGAAFTALVLLIGYLRGQRRRGTPRQLGESRA